MNWEKIFGFKPDPKNSFGDYVKKPSPDRKHLMVFAPGIEVSMMRWSQPFRLIEPAGKVAEAFNGLNSPMQAAWWSKDSRVVAVPVCDRKDCLLLFHVARRRYSVILSNPYQQKAKLTTRGVWITPNLREFRAMFGRRFSPPEALHFPFASLQWFPATEKWNLNAALRVAPRVRWTPPPGRELKAYARKNGITLNG